jgi:hypothetical protein
MSRRALGLASIALGVVLITAGVIVASSEPSGETAAVSPTTTPTASTSTNVLPTTSTNPSTTIAPPTTSTVPATTTTLPTETVEEFVEAFAAALDNGDSAFVLERLHPDVIDGYTLQACETWVTDEIMGLSNYELTGDPTGPVDKSVTIAGSPATINDVYTAPVRFMFGGQSFDVSADFAVVENLVHWLGACE